MCTASRPEHASKVTLAKGQREGMMRLVVFKQNLFDLKHSLEYP